MCTNQQQSMNKSNLGITSGTPSVQTMVANQKTPKTLEQSLSPTAAETNIINYHRNTIKTGKVGTDEEGRPVTVYSTGIMIPEGKDKGKFVAVPGYVNGKIIQSEDQLYDIWKKDIQAGKWPTYNSGKELNARSQALHQIMDDEESAAIMSRNSSKK